MNGLDWDLDEMVGMIMAELRKNSPAPRSDNLSETLSRDFSHVNDGKKLTASAASEVLEVVERVIVVETVVKLASSSALKKWRVVADAVVTPAALDELKKRGIELERKISGSVAVSPKGAASASRVALSSSNVARKSVDASASNGTVDKSVQVLLATHFQGSEQAPRAIVDYLKRNAEFSEFRLDCLKTTASRVAEELVANEKLKVVVTTHDGAIGSVWLNRKKGVRAVVAFSVEQAKRDIKAANANTLIVDPRDLGAYQARQVVDFFVNMK